MLCCTSHQDLALIPPSLSWRISRSSVSLAHRHTATKVDYTKSSCPFKVHQWLPLACRTKSRLLSVDPSMVPILIWSVLPMSLSFYHSLHKCPTHFLISQILHNILFLNLHPYLESRWDSSSSMKSPSISKQEIASHSSSPPLYYIHFLWSLFLFLFFFSATFSIASYMVIWITAPKN